MNEDEKIKDEGDSATAPKPEKDYLKDENNKARLRAGKRSSNVNAGKPMNEGMNDDGDKGDTVPAIDENTSVEEPKGFADGGEVPAEGGIAAEAHKELEAVTGDKPEGESEGEAETAPAPDEPGEKTEEPETAVEKFAEEEMKEPEHKDSGAVEQFAKEEAKEPQHQQKMSAVGDYVPPEGESHDELIDKYHEAMAFGDMVQAKDLYKKLQEHRFAENSHRAKSTAQAEQEAQAYADAADALVAKHPELGEDGLPANKVMALSDVYRQEGMSATEALQKAVADLYPEAPAAAAPPEAAAPEAEAPAAEAPPEEVPPPAEETAPMETKAEETPPADIVPPMEDRMANKRKIVTLPSANARKEETPPPKTPTRSDAIQLMKEKRGQA
jgi:hypothetical protein